MAYDKRKMQDISLSEHTLWLQYSQYIKNAEIDNAKRLLENNPNLKYKVFNSFNFNRLKNLVNDGTEWAIGPNSKITTNSSTECLVGNFAKDYNNLVDKNQNTSYVGFWSENIDYKKNNLVKLNDRVAYFCIADHKGSLENKPPNNNFWVVAVGGESPGIPVASELPTGAQLYFKIL